MEKIFHPKVNNTNKKKLFLRKKNSIPLPWWDNKTNRSTFEFPWTFRKGINLVFRNIKEARVGVGVSVFQIFIRKYCSTVSSTRLRTVEPDQFIRIQIWIILLMNTGSYKDLPKITINNVFRSFSLRNNLIIDWI